MVGNRWWNRPFGICLARIQSVSRTGPQFEIDVSSRYRAGIAAYRIWLISGCVGLSLSITWNIWQGVLVYGETQTIEAELERVRHLDRMMLAEAKHEGVDLSEDALKRLFSEVNLANQLLEKRAFSWTTLLTELEQTIPPRLALASVRLDQTGKTVHLTGAAMSLEDITAFTVGLQNHAMFKDPVLAQHRVGSNGLVDFDVTVQYRPNGV